MIVGTIMECEKISKQIIKEANNVPSIAKYFFAPNFNAKLVFMEFFFAPNFNANGHS